MRRFIKMFKNSLIGQILKVIFKLLVWALEAVIIFLAIVIVTQRVTNDQETFLGFRIYNVATGSMEPEYAVGDILISKEKDPSKIKVGDNIVYLGDEGGYDGKIITHNVIAIEQEENGDYLFHTKGRANTVEDPIVHEDQLYGVVVQNNQVLAFLCRILTNRYGLYFFAVIPITIYFFIGFIKSQGEKIEAEREEKRLAEERRRKKKSHARKVQKMQRAKEIEEEIEEVEEQIEDDELEEDKLEEEEVIEEKTKTSKKQKNATGAKKKKQETQEEVGEKKKKTTTSKVVKTKTTAEGTTAPKTEKNKEELESKDTPKKAATRKKKTKEE